MSVRHVKVKQRDDDTGIFYLQNLNFKEKMTDILSFIKVCAGFLTYLIYPPRCPVCDRVLRGNAWCLFTEAYSLQYGKAYNEKYQADQAYAAEMSYPNINIHSMDSEKRQAIRERSTRNSWICPECAGKIRILREPLCRKCGKKIRDERKEYCYDCGRKKHVYTSGHALWNYQGAVRHMLHHFKYGERQDYALYIGTQMAYTYENWMRQKGIDLIVPIPLHQKRYQKRGYNQAELLAQIISNQTGIRMDANALQRIKETSPQKSLNDMERKKNLEKAFITNENIVKSKKVLLVDDIYTTGSTIDAAATTLKENGALDVYYLSASIGAN